ncbi:MAG: helix-turn-helix transcriptional regulator, partial [bacterium]|nr:helix-turn-helix transcriptional regulator [bacterium]
MSKENDVAKRLKAIREALGLKQNHFAQRLHVSGPLLSELESGKYKPKFNLIVNLVREFNVNLYYLYFGEGEMFAGGDSRGKPRALSEYDILNKTHFIDFLENIERSPFLEFSILSHYRLLMSKEKETIQEEFDEYEKKKAA